MEELRGFSLYTVASLYHPLPAALHPNHKIQIQIQIQIQIPVQIQIQIQIQIQYKYKYAQDTLWPLSLHAMRTNLEKKIQNTKALH